MPVGVAGVLLVLIPNLNQSRLIIPNLYESGGISGTSESGKLSGIERNYCETLIENSQQLVNTKKTTSTSGLVKPSKAKIGGCASAQLEIASEWAALSTLPSIQLSILAGDGIEITVNIFSFQEPLEPQKICKRNLSLLAKVPSI